MRTTEPSFNPQQSSFKQKEEPRFGQGTQQFSLFEKQAPQLGRNSEQYNPQLTNFRAPDQAQGNMWQLNAPKNIGAPVPIPQIPLRN